MNQQTDNLHTLVSDEECLKRIAGRVASELFTIYGELTPQIVEHVIDAALYQISFALRRGEPLALEPIGQLIPAQIGNCHVVVFRPVASLTGPMPNEQRELVSIADRRMRA